MNKLSILTLLITILFSNNLFAIERIVRIQLLHANQQGRKIFKLTNAAISSEEESPLYTKKSSNNYMNLDPVKNLFRSYTFSVYTVGEISNLFNNMNTKIDNQTKNLHSELSREQKKMQKYLASQIVFTIGAIRNDLKQQLKNDPEFRKELKRELLEDLKKEILNEIKKYK